MRLQAVARGIVKLDWGNWPTSIAVHIYNLALRAGEWLANLEERRALHQHVLAAMLWNGADGAKQSIALYQEIANLLVPGTSSLAIKSEKEELLEMAKLYRERFPDKGNK